MEGEFDTIYRAYEAYNWSSRTWQPMRALLGDIPEVEFSEVICPGGANGSLFGVQGNNFFCASPRACNDSVWRFTA